MLLPRWLGLAGAFGFALPATASAHGTAPLPPTVADALLAWSFEAHVLLPLAVMAVAYGWAVGRVAAEHPGNPVPRWRTWSWYGGVFVLFVALASPIATFDTTFFTAHMIQHLLMTLVAAPLLALGAPITLALRVASATTRRKWLLPLLHSRLLRVVSFPVLTWIVFAGVMWVSHFSPLFDAALENEVAHVAEHALFMGAALLFWWPVVGADPSVWRLPHPARIGYLFLGMPQSSFLGLAIFSAPGVLYPHYATLQRPWGPSALVDQQWAGGIMWAGGDAVFLVAMVTAIVAWLRSEEAEGRRVDALLDHHAAQARRAAGPAAPGSAPQQ